MGIGKVCECGYWIVGETEKDVNYNFKKHRNGKKHKKQMKRIKRHKSSP